jgi:hypothetical protein
MKNTHACQDSSRDGIISLSYTSELDPSVQKLQIQVEV